MCVVVIMCVLSSSCVCVCVILIAQLFIAKGVRPHLYIGVVAKGIQSMVIATGNERILGRFFKGILLFIFILVFLCFFAE